jgi:cell division protease FtsH
MVNVKIMAWTIKTTALTRLHRRPVRAGVFDAFHPPYQEAVTQDIKVVKDVLRAPKLEASISDFVKDVERNKVLSVYLDKDGSKLVAVDNEGELQSVMLPDQADILNFLVSQGVRVTVVDSPEDEHFNLGMFFLQLGLFYVVLTFITNRINMSSLKKGAPNNEETDTGVTFADVAGVDNAKHDLQEIVEFLQHPERYTKVGAKIPRGALLVGPPGTGKTLLARAVAGEAGVPFFSCSGSEFVEMFVGVGASRVRDLFKRAIAKAPCIVFIDEIDAIGKQRSSGAFGGANDEKDQTINQLLTEMDGFKGNTGVIVMAATNRADILDEALLRPGRFDRHIHVDLPDKKGRTEILAIHTQGKPLDGGVSLEALAGMTVGFSGADLQNLCNEAAIYTARRNGETIILHDFEQAIDRLTIGEERRTLLITDHKKRVIAYHEAGHALMSLLVNDFDKLRKISIVPRGSTGGATYFEPSEDRVDIALVSRDYLESQILVSLGGRLAEELVFGESQVTTGAAGDLMQVYSIAHQMVVNYGFSKNLGPVYWGESQGLSAEIEMEIKSIVDELYDKGKRMLEHNREYLDRVTEQLLEKETLTLEEVLPIVNGINNLLD